MVRTDGQSCLIWWKCLFFLSLAIAVFGSLDIFFLLLKTVILANLETVHFFEDVDEFFETEKKFLVEYNMK